MKQAQFFDAGLEGQIKGIGVLRVSPVNKGFIFPGCVFGIMDEKISFAAKIKIVLEFQPTGVDIAQLVVRQKNKTPTILYEFLSAAAVRMAERNGNNRNRSDLKLHRACSRIRHLGGDILVFYGEIRGCHNLGENGFHEFAVIGAPMHVNVKFFEKQRFKKRKAHQVIPVGMGKDKIQIGGFFVGQKGSQTAYSGARIHNNNIAAFGPDFHTSRVSTIFKIFFT